MAIEDTVLVIDPDGQAWHLPWPTDDSDRRQAVRDAIGTDQPAMTRCGKGILGFHSGNASGTGAAQNLYAAKAFTEQNIALPGPLFGSVLFARNPSKGSAVKPLTSAQATNLLIVTGVDLVG